MISPLPWISDDQGFLYSTEKGTFVAEFPNQVDAYFTQRAANHYSEMKAALIGAADALAEAGKSFALNNPNAHRPNLFEQHEQSIRELLKGLL